MCVITAASRVSGLSVWGGGTEPAVWGRGRGGGGRGRGGGGGVDGGGGMSRGVDGGVGGERGRWR